jgi:hypothetical protein
LGTRLAASLIAITRTGRPWRSRHHDIAAAHRLHGPPEGA